MAIGKLILAIYLTEVEVLKRNTCSYQYTSFEVGNKKPSNELNPRKPTQMAYL